jgi:hypothetical protein
MTLRAAMPARVTEGIDHFLLETCTDGDALASRTVPGYGADDDHDHDGGADGDDDDYLT